MCMFFVIIIIKITIITIIIIITTIIGTFSVNSFSQVTMVCSLATRAKLTFGELFILGLVVTLLSEIYPAI